MKTIGFIGVGIMGKPMVRNLMKHGFAVQIFARHPEKVADVVQEGAKLLPSITACAQGCDVVITMVGFPPDVEEVYFAPGNILDSAAPGTYLVDMTTTSPTLAKKIYAQGKAKGFHVVDAPVTGGDTGAIKGTLSVLVGGDAADFKALLPVFQAVGTNINYQGQAGNGQHAKMANQIMIAGALSGVCEALAYAQREGLDLEVLLKSVATGAAGSAQLNAFGQKIIDHDYAPGFYMKHFIKDMTIAKDEAEKQGLQLNVLQQVLDTYRHLEEQGKGDLGTQALSTYYEK